MLRAPVSLLDQGPQIAEDATLILELLLDSTPGLPKRGELEVPDDSRLPLLPRFIPNTLLVVVEECLLIAQIEIPVEKPKTFLLLNWVQILPEQSIDGKGRNNLSILTRHAVLESTFRLLLLSSKLPPQKIDAQSCDE